ncbi:MAG: efflux RND transporter permease subunit [Bacteroidales bacterium]|nr:efflux RND transporter permease subunit [Bacteroidales bacterium]
MEKFANILLKYKSIILLIIGVITLFFVLQIKDLTINSDVTSYLPKTDSAVVLFNKIGENFKGNNILIVGYTNNDIFTYESLKEIKTITDTLNTIKGISAITSIINVLDIRLIDSVIHIVPLIDEYELPYDKHTLDSIKNYVLSKETYKGTFVSDDVSTTLITVRYENDFSLPIDKSLKKDSLFDYYNTMYPSPIYKIEIKNDSLFIKINKTELTSIIKDKLKKIKLNGKIVFGGMPAIVLDLNNIIKRDMLYLGTIAGIIILTILFIIFKNWQGVILPVLIVGIAIAWVFGTMSLFKIEINMLTNTIPVILLAIGTAYSIHVINRIREMYLNGYDIIYSIKESLKYIIVPVFFAALTTMIGFISFIFGSYLIIIKYFGIFTALGVFYSFILAIIIVPILLSYFPYKMSEDKKIKEKNSSKLNYLLRKILSLCNYKPTATIILFSAIFIVFSIFIFNIKRKVDIIEYFKEKHDTKISEQFLRKQFGGTTYMFINTEGDAQNIEQLKWLDSLQQYMKKHPLVSNTLSIVDILKEMNNLMGEGKKLPNTQQKIDNLWFLLEGQEQIQQIVSSDKKQALLQVILKSSTNKDLEDIINYTEKFFKTHKTNAFKYYHAGYPAIYVHLDNSIVQSQLYSLIIAILLMYFIISFLLKSLKKGILAITPVVGTCLLLFGSMGLFNIPLDIATVLVASVSIGIGIDYAIHLINHISYELKQTKNLQESINNATLISGKAILINVITVTMGFLVILFSDLTPLVNFSILIAITMISSGFTSITLLPAMFVKFLKK